MVRFLRGQILICTIFCLVCAAASAARHSTEAKAAQSNASSSSSTKVLTGQEAFTDAAHESPGTRRHLTVKDLPGPNEKESVDNGARMEFNAELRHLMRFHDFVITEKQN